MLLSFHGSCLTSPHSLVIYAIFPILEKYDYSLNGIDPSLEEAGIAGMTKWGDSKSLFHWPCLSLLIGVTYGNRYDHWDSNSSCSCGSAGGLGSFITLGSDRRMLVSFLIGTISSAILAILFNVILKWLEKAKVAYDCYCTAVMSTLVWELVMLQA